MRVEGELSLGTSRDEQSITVSACKFDLSSVFDSTLDNACHDFRFGLDDVRNPIGVRT